MGRYHIVLDGGLWCEQESKEEAIDYADWLVTMPSDAPEAKGDSVHVLDCETAEIIFAKDRIK